MKEKQEFSSTSLFVVLGMTALCLGVVSMPWNSRIQNTNSSLAIQKAEAAGYQIAQLYREATKSNPVSVSGVRGPASISAKSLELRQTGTVGKDPWGESFQYRFLQESGQPLKVLVWSSGPNKQVDTLDLVDDGVTVSGQPRFQGDDLGVVLVIR